MIGELLGIGVWSLVITCSNIEFLNVHNLIGVRPQVRSFNGLYSDIFASYDAALEVYCTSYFHYRSWCNAASYYGHQTPPSIDKS